jgi:P4 family phage/plasmid primase-like protien
VSDDTLARARRYHALGFSLVPLEAGKKTPDASVLPLDADGRPTWTPFQMTRPTDEQLVAWFGNGVRRNIAIVPREIYVFVDGDSAEALAWMQANLPPTNLKTRTARGEHWGYRRPYGVGVPAEIRVSDTLRIELKREGQYLVAPGSLHPSGAVYEEIEPWPSDGLSIPFFPNLAPGATAKAATRSEPLAEHIPDGGRNKTLFREGCRLRRLGFEEPEILAALTAVNQRRCHPPLPAREVQTIAAGCARYEPAAEIFPLTEAGDAAFFAVQYANDVRYDHWRDRWLVLDEQSGIWLPDGDGRVTRLALDTMRARQQQALKISDTAKRKQALDWSIRGESRARLANMLALAQDFEPIADAGKDWDGIPHLAGTEAGVVDLRTGIVRRAEPDERITMRTTVPYDADAQSDLWDKTLADVFPEEDERAYLQVALGYTATGEMNLDKWFLPNGPKGRNGKGTILGAVRAALGDYALELDAATFDRRKDGAPFNLAKLPGKRFAHCSEAGDSTTLHHDRIKQISGGDSLMAGDKHQKAFEFSPVCKLWFSCNTRPKVSDESAAFWARVVVILFAQTFLNREDTSIRDALRQDPRHQRAVLRWLVDGARRYYAQQGLGPMPKAFQKATAEFQLENDRLAEFYEAECVTGDKCKAKASELWNAYRTWAETEKVKYPLGSKSFYQQLASRFGEPRRDAEAKWYQGIELKAMAPEPEIPF